MFRRNETPITLAIANSRLELHVISFTGREALNEPYHFDIDLISPTPIPDFNALMSRSAFLSFGAQNQEQDHGIHGLIGSVVQLHAGLSLSRYHLTLVPRLQVLQRRSHRRIFQGLSAPQIIVQLLEEHDIDDASYRFEQAVGFYPPRTICVQYDESDLHLLQRLCEEEGIHYRFEHSRVGHLMIFADDPSSFPELPMPTRFQMDDGRTALQPTINHLAERFRIHPGYSSHHQFQIDAHSLSAQHNLCPAPAPDSAANHACETFHLSVRKSLEESRLRQSSERSLERLRCERRQVHGLSNQPALVSGRILQVLDHPDNLFNDQWLLTEIHHAGKQPHLLEGYDPFDIAAIFVHDQPRNSPQWQTSARVAQPPPEAGIAPFSHGYRNHFRVLPWAMPFRPPLNHRKPQIHDCQTATLMGKDSQPVRRDAQGRVQVRFHWQLTHPPQRRQGNTDNCCWLPLASHGRLPSRLTAGTTVLVSYFDNDPDRPVICGHLFEAAAPPPLQPRIRIDGLPLEPMPGHIHLSAGQALQVDALLGLTLNTLQSKIELESGSIKIMHPQSVSREPHRAYEIRPPVQETAACSEDRSPYNPSPRPSIDLSVLYRSLDRSLPEE